jgi:hypothetical protein
MKRILLVGALCVVSTFARAQEVDWQHLNPKKATPLEWQRLMEFMDRQSQKYNETHQLWKVTGDPNEIRSRIMHGNKITTIVYNYGNITRPNLTPSNTLDLVWNRLGYGFEFTPLVGGHVIDDNGRTLHILDDGMWLPSEGQYATDGSIKYGWLPKPGYAAPKPGNLDIAAWSDRGEVSGDLTRKPHSWPESWYNASLGRYVWPAFLGNDATSPDEEVYFVDDDYTNANHPTYHPFPGDTTKHGLGLDLEVRFFQFNNPLAEDIIFLVYRITNKSPKSIDTVFFGMYGDPHVGGDADYADDLAGFIPPRGLYAQGIDQRARSIVYAWDSDHKGMGGLVPGYFGFKFLESPTNSTNGIDDDDDGIIDESPFNDAGFYIDGVTYPLTYGIADTAKYRAVYGAPKPRWSGDENGNWDPLKDDVGLDGLPGTGDIGEGNGKPDIGYDNNGNLVSEPHFGIRDVNESDQIGLTSFWALPYGAPNNPKSDQLFYGYISADSIDINQRLLVTPGDNIFLYGSGPFRLDPAGTQRFSVALLMGNDRPDLLLNSETSARILEANYQFAQPPPKPIVRAVPGDHRVTLYWDTGAEKALDPLTGINDFEGYKIYRSEDYTFSDVFKITDANGTPFLGSPFQQNGVPAQFDLVDGWSGLHPVDYIGRGIKYNLGNNTGLVHEYIDSSVTNGKTYYYAVASYDFGFDSLGIALPPTECQITITRDPITSALSFDQNTVAVTPGPLPSGLISAGADSNNFADHVNGIATGTIKVQILEDLLVPDRAQFNVQFRTSNSNLVFDVKSLSLVEEQFEAKDTVYVGLVRKNIVDTSVTVLNASGGIVDASKYRVDGPGGKIRGVLPGDLPRGALYTIRYRYYPVFASTHFSGEDDNPSFDGMRVFANNVILGIDSLNSGWVGSPATNLVGVVQKPAALPAAVFKPAPLDFEVRWNNTDTTANGKWAHPGDTLLNNAGRKLVVCPFRIVNVTDTSRVRILVDKALTDSMWRPGRELVIVTPPKYQPVQNPLPVLVGIMFLRPAGSLVLPSQGDIFAVKTAKPFADGDAYNFTTRAVRFDVPTAQSVLDRIYVVPNPYVAYSTLEAPSTITTSRGDRKLQFRNLPPQCTIRIYTMVGELVNTIVKSDNNSFANWDLLSYEGQRVAYGIYLYHVDVPGVGEKIGRFAVIK